MTFSHGLSTNNYGPAKFIVSSSAANGTHTTIASALTSASSGDTIFIRAGSYTENLTLKVGVNLAVFTGDSNTPNVTIIGNLSLTAAGSVTISNISLQTNSNFILSVTGSAASVVNLVNCGINCTNNTGISFTTSSSSAAINIYNCIGNIGTTGITLFSHSSAGTLTILNSLIVNSGNSTTANTISSGLFLCEYTKFLLPITSSSTAALQLNWCTIDNAAINTTSITAGGSGTQNISYCNIQSGTATAIVCTTTINSLYYCFIGSSNTNAISGAGTLNYLGLTFAASASQKISTTTQVGGTLQGGLTQAPSAGFLGEQISSYAATVALTNGTPKTITSISLTAGVWDLYALIYYANSSAANSTAYFIGVSATNNTFEGNVGDKFTFFTVPGTGGADNTLSLPCFRVVLTTTTTYFLIGQSNFTAGTSSASGRISATRVG